MTYARTDARTDGRESLGLQRLRRETKNNVPIASLPCSNKDKSITKFWLRHYSYGEQFQVKKLKVEEVYNLFKITYPNAQASMEEFHSVSTRVGVKVKKKARNKWYLAIPLSDLSANHHLAKPRDDENNPHKYTLCLANIRGLITKEINKVPLLGENGKTIRERQNRFLDRDSFD